MLLMVIQIGGGENPNYKYLYVRERSY